MLMKRFCLCSLCSHPNVLIYLFFPLTGFWGMLRRFKCVQIFFENMLAPSCGWLVFATAATVSSSSISSAYAMWRYEGLPGMADRFPRALLRRI